MATISVNPCPSEPDVHPEARAERVPGPVRVLIVFNTVALYGMERQVIELFDLLRPEVEPHFLLSYTTYRKQLPLLTEIERRGLAHSFLSDRIDWPKIGCPHSLREAWRMAVAMVKGNRDVLRRSLACDAIYLPAWGYGLFALAAAAWARLSGKRVIYCFHDLSRRRLVPLQLVSLFVTDCAHHTRSGYELITRTNPYIAHKKTFICPTRTQTTRLCDSDPQVRRVLEGKRNLLFVGQVGHHKGIDLLVAAFASLAPAYPELRLHVLGSGPAERELQLLVASLGLQSRVQLWGYRSDVHEFLRGTYLYIHPSPPSRFQEAFGRGVAEAMSQRVPTVCFRSGALQEIVVHGKTGLICEEETAECLATHIRKFLDDPGLRSACGQAALIRFQEMYSDDSIRGRWLKFLS